MIADKKSANVVEKICHQGCKTVYQCIDKMEKSEDFAEISELDEAQRKIVLKELKDIMDVYDGKLCSTN